MMPRDFRRRADRGNHWSPWSGDLKMWNLGEDAKPIMARLPCRLKGLLT